MKNLIGGTSWAIRCARWWLADAAANRPQAWSRSAGCHRGSIRKRDGGRPGPNWDARCGPDRGSVRKLARGGVHDVDVVGAAPTEGQQLAIGRPRRVSDVAFVWEVQLGLAGAVGIHEVELGS